MNVLALPVRHKLQTRRPVVMLESTTCSSACGHRNLPEAAFCGACGTSLSPQHLSCAICGQPYPARVTFCRSCGTDHSTALPPAFPSTAATRRSAVERLSPSSPQALEHVATALSPP